MSEEIASDVQMEEEKHTDAEPAMSDKETVVTDIHDVAPDETLRKSKITPRYLGGPVGSCHDYCKYGKKREDEVKPWRLARKKKPVEVGSEDKSAPESNESAESKAVIAGRKTGTMVKNAGNSSGEQSSTMKNIKKTEDSPRGSVKKVSKVSFNPKIVNGVSSPKNLKSTQNKKSSPSSSVDDAPEKTVYVVKSSVEEKGRDDIRQGPSPSASSSRNKIEQRGKLDGKRPPFLPPGTRIRPVRLLSKSRSISRRSGLYKDKQNNSENVLDDSKAENKTSLKKTGFLSKTRSIGRRSSLSKHKQNNSENGLEDSKAENKAGVKKTGFLSKTRSIGKRSNLSRHKQNNSEDGLEKLIAENETSGKKTGFFSKSRSIGKRSVLSRHKQNNSENGLESSEPENKTSLKKTGFLSKTRSIGRRSGLSRHKQNNSEDGLEDSKAENKAGVKKTGFLSMSRSIGKRSALSRHKQNNSENGLEDSEAENKTGSKKTGFLSKTRSIGKRSALSRHKQNNSKDELENLIAENKKAGFFSKSRSIGKRSSSSRHKQNNSETGLEDSKAENQTSNKKTGFLSKTRSIGRRSSLSRHKQNNSVTELENSKAKNKTSAKTAEMELTTAIRKLSFIRSKSIELQRQDSILRRLRFRKRSFHENSNSQRDGLRKTLMNRGDGDGKTDDGEAKREKVVLRHRNVEGKKKMETLFNNMIEETAKQLAKVRKSKVKALVGAFETVISLQHKQPSFRLNRRRSLRVKG